MTSTAGTRTRAHHTGKGWRRWRAAVGVLVALGAALLAAGPAFGDLVVSVQPQFPSSITVGDNASATLVLTNSSTSPQSAAAVALSDIRLYPACTVDSADCAGGSTVPEAFRLAAAGSGAGACAGTWTLSENSPGVWTFSPPGGASTVTLAAGQTCSVGFTFFAGRAGGPWFQVTNATVTHPSAGAQRTSGSTSRTVEKAQPIVTIEATPSIVIGDVMTAVVTLEGRPGLPAPTGSITFFITGNACDLGDGQFYGPVPLTGGPPPTATLSIAPGTVGGYGWIPSYDGDQYYHPVADEDPCGDVTVVTTVHPASPTIHTTATPIAAVGQPITDTGSVSGGYNPVGGFSFKLYGPNDPNCTGEPIFTSPKQSSARSLPFTPTVPGEYRWIGQFHPGNANNNPATGACGDPNETTIVTNRAELAVNDVSVLEGDAGTTPLTFTVTRSADTSGPSTVQWSTSNGSAIAPGDYVAVPPATLSFAAGETTKTVTVMVNGDTAVETNDGFTVNLTSPAGAVIVDGAGVGRIMNDDAASFSVGDASTTEGNAGTKLMSFTISRSGDLGGPAAVNWRTLNAHATAPSDYVAVPPTTLSFAAGETSKVVTVVVNGDTAVEPLEDFYVRLESPSGATIADGSGLGRIVNDDNATFSVNDAVIVEGNAGTRSMTFTVSRAGALGGPASVRWATADGTATAGSDYVAVAPATLAFAAGETSKTVSVNINGDTAVEANEVFYARLTSPLGGTLADGSGVGRITNDDSASLTVNDVTAAEGNAGTKLMSFTISRSGAIAGAATVQWFTADGTAVAGSDYVAVAPTTVTFAPGEITKTVSVTVNGDTIVEPSETFSVRLSGAAGATMGDGSGLGRISNDDS